MKLILNFSHVFGGSSASKEHRFVEYRMYNWVNCDNNSDKRQHCQIVALVEFARDLKLANQLWYLTNRLSWSGFCFYIPSDAAYLNWPLRETVLLHTGSKLYSLPQSDVLPCWNCYGVMLSTTPFQKKPLKVSRLFPTAASQTATKKKGTKKRRNANNRSFQIRR